VYVKDTGKPTKRRGVQAKQSPPDAPPQPARLPQRWLLILSVSAVVAAVVGITTSAGVGVTIAVGVVALLHQIVD
jgi:hypothetical protein